MKKDAIVKEGDRFWMQSKVIMLPTQKNAFDHSKEGDLIYNETHGLGLREGFGHPNGVVAHLYFLSDEEAKVGDWVNVFCSEIGVNDIRRVAGYYNEQFLFADKSQIHIDYCQKIIATTDDLLIFCQCGEAPHKMSCDSNYWQFLPKPSIEFLREYVSQKKQVDLVWIECANYAFVVDDFPDESGPRYKLKISPQNTITARVSEFKNQKMRFVSCSDTSAHYEILNAHGYALFEVVAPLTENEFVYSINLAQSQFRGDEKTMKWINDALGLIEFDVFKHKHGRGMPVKSPLDYSVGGESISNLDPLIDDCIAYAKLEGKIRRGTLQRKFKLGYVRAGRIMAQIEAAGIFDDENLGRYDSDREVKSHKMITLPENNRQIKKEVLECLLKITEPAFPMGRIWETTKHLYPSGPDGQWVDYYRMKRDVKFLRDCGYLILGDGRGRKYSISDKLKNLPL